MGDNSVLGGKSEIYRPKTNNCITVGTIKVEKLTRGRGGGGGASIPE